MEMFQSIAERIEVDREQQALSKNQKYKRKTIKNLILDVVTRWNSVFFMLERALEFSDVSFSSREHICVTNIGTCCL